MKDDEIHEDSEPLKPDERVLTVLSLDHLERAVDLWQMLLWRTPKAAVSQPNAVRVAPSELSFSASICILALTGLDGALARCHYLRPTCLDKGTKASWADRVKELDPGIPSDLLLALQELAILRDTLVHNHVWEVGFKWGDEQEDSMVQLNLTPGFGDSKHPAFTDRSSHVTSGPLQLQLIPIQLTREDALIVFGAIWAVLIHLECVLGKGIVQISDYLLDVRPDRMADRDTMVFPRWLSMSIQAHGGRAREVLERIGAMNSLNGKS